MNTILPELTGYFQTGTIFTSDPERDFPSPPLFVKVILPFLCAFGIAGNSLIIFQFVKSRALQNASNLFIINLALADLVVIICMGPQINNILAYGGRQGYGDWACTFHAIIIVISTETSIVTIGLIAFSRYVAIVHHKKKATLLSWRLCIIMCLLSWVYSALITIPAMLGWGRIGWIQQNYLCTYDWAYNIVYNALLFLFSFGLTYAIMCFSYRKIYQMFSDSKRRIATDESKVNCVSKDELRLAFQLLTIFIIYNLCWSPYLLVSMLIDPHGQGPQWMYGICIILLYWNSSVNVLVYLYYNKVFRAECLRIVVKVRTGDSSGKGPTASTSAKTNK